MRCVIDTNIIISSILSGRGKPRTFMSDVYQGKYDVVVSNTIMEEYERVLRYEKFGFTEQEIQFVLNWFHDNAIFIEIDEHQPIPEMDNKDPSDKPFYLLAKSTKSLLVTGNVKHFPVEEWRTMLWEIL